MLYLPALSALHVVIFNKMIADIKAVKESSFAIDEQLLDAIKKLENAIIHIIQREYPAAEEILFELRQLKGELLERIKNLAIYLVATFSDKSEAKTILLSNLYHFEITQASAVQPEEYIFIEESGLEVGFTPTAASYTPWQHVDGQQFIQQVEENSNFDFMKKVYRTQTAQDRACVVLNQVYKNRNHFNNKEILTQIIAEKIGIEAKSIYSYYDKLTQFGFLVKNKNDFFLTDIGKKWCEKNIIELNRLDEALSYVERYGTRLR